MANKSFIGVLCDFQRHIRFLFMITLLSIIILLLSLEYVEPGSGTYVITLVQLVTFGAVFLLSGIVMILCARQND